MKKIILLVASVAKVFSTNAQVKVLSKQIYYAYMICKKCLLVSERGMTTIQIQAGQLAAGVYTYLLIGDGNLTNDFDKIGGGNYEN
ncbi:MAG: hypothetical protein LBG80_02770 [Bacteroidales bacterium]|nr:hypothetical protein [Bacteroidales bacterium]